MFANAGQKFLLNMYTVMKISTAKLRKARTRDKSKVTIEAVSLRSVKEE